MEAVGNSVRETHLGQGGTFYVTRVEDHEIAPVLLRSKDHAEQEAVPLRAVRVARREDGLRRHRAIDQLGRRRRQFYTPGGYGFLRSLGYPSTAG